MSKTPSILITYVIRNVQEADRELWAKRAYLWISHIFPDKAGEWAICWPASWPKWSQWREKQ